MSQVIEYANLFYAKITGIPWVRNISVTAGVFHQLMDFALLISAENTSHIADVGTVHTDEQIVFIVVTGFKLNGSFTAWVNAVTFKNSLCRRINRIADSVPYFFCTGSRGGNYKIFFQAPAPNHIF
jgi:hypothetical protein